MSYSIQWREKSVCVDYFGEIDNNDIESAHFALNGDARFYDCHSLVLDISKCNMDRVEVDGLMRVIATDLGASQTTATLKVAMIAVDAQNIEKASRYIGQCREYDYPWHFQIFGSRGAAQRWLDA